jgi:hypothetical protein
MTAMLKKIGGMLDRARKLEAAMTASIEGAAGRMTGTPAERPPLEIAHAIVDAVADDIQPTGRGQNGFPFNLIKVTLVASTARARAQLQGVIDGPDPLAQRIVTRLRAAGCDVAGLSVRIAYVSRARAEWPQQEFHVECVRVDRQEAAAAEPLPRLKLAVLAGSAASATFAFGATVVAIGRGAEISDSRGRLVRVNHVAFTDGDDAINQTVSRLHARIEHDAATGAYRVFDDGSAQGTSVIRQGRGYPVARGSRGMTLAPGDEIVLGRARLKVNILR